MSGTEQPPGRITPSRREPDTATDEAARWLVALDEADGDAELRARFSAWLAADPAHAAAWTDTSEVYELLGQLPTGDRKHWTGPGTSPLRKRRARMLAIAAVALAAAATVVVMTAPSLRLRLQADYVTGAGEQRDLTLADGSVVRLGPSSALASTFGGSRRRVELLSGAAFFTVTHDPQRPFHVSARSVQATALGTAFEVRITDGVVVAVEEGVVGVESRSDGSPPPQRLAAGDWVRVGAAGELERGRTSAEEVAAWRRGLIVARDLPLRTVLDEIRPYHRGAILLTDANLGGRRVSGVYNLADPGAAIRAAVAVHGGVVRAFSPWLIVISGS